MPGTFLTVENLFSSVILDKILGEELINERILNLPSRKLGSIIQATFFYCIRLLPFHL